MSSALIRLDTSARLLSSSSALYWATIDLRTSFPIDGRTRSSKSVPSSRYSCGSFSMMGRHSTRSLMFTICRSFVFVTLGISRGLVRTSMMMGRWTTGMRKCVPSTLTSG